MFHKGWKLSNHFCFNAECPIRKGRNNIVGSQLVAIYQEAEIGLFKCSGCHSVYYCSSKCQKESWKSGHRVDCKAFQSSLPNGVMAMHVPVARMIDGSIISGRKASQFVLRCANVGSAEMNKIYFMVLRMMSMKVAKCDDFDRKRKCLPSRPANQLFPCHLDYIQQGGYENEKIFCDQINEFSVWIMNESSAGTDFGDLEVYFDFVIEGLCMLEELTPTESNGWITKREANIVHSLIAAASIQKGYIMCILNPRHALHSYVTLLRSYVDWNGPLEHVWHDVIFTLYKALILGIDLSEKSYNCPVDPTQLLPLYPIAKRILQQFLLIYPVTIFEEFNHSHIINTTSTSHSFEQECREFCDWLTNKKRGFLHLVLTLACSIQLQLFSDVDLSPLLPMAYHYKTEINKFFSRYSSSQLSSTEVPFFASRLEYIINNAEPINQPRQNYRLYWPIPSLILRSSSRRRRELKNQK